MTEEDYYLIAALFLGVFDLICEAASSAFQHSNLARLISQPETMDPRVQQTINLVRAQPRLLATFRLVKALFWASIFSLTLLSISRRAALSAPGVPGNPLLLLGYGLLLGLSLFLLEWFVQQFISKDAEHWAFRFTPFTRFLEIIVSPILALPLRATGNGQAQLEAASTLVVTEDELKTLVDASQQEGVLQLGEHKMIHSIFDLGDTLAREIMVPRIDVLALDVNTPLVEAVDALLDSGFSRVPVYEESIDNVLGLLYAKDLLRVWREGGQINSLRELLRAAYFVPEAKKVDELLAEIQSQRVHMAIVVDEYGGVAGLVTLEDIVEEILGEIQDEYDQAEELPYRILPEGEYLFLGRIDIDDFNDVLASELPKDEADTLGGFMYSRLGHVPTSGEVVQVGNLRLAVEQVTGRRIRTVRASRVADQPENLEEASNAES